MRVAFTTGWMGLVGKTRQKLPAGQTFMRSFGVSAVTFTTPTYTTMAATGTATVSFVSAATATLAVHPTSRDPSPPEPPP